MRKPKSTLMKTLPSLGAPLALALLACTPVQAATGAGPSNGHAKQTAPDSIPFYKMDPHDAGHTFEIVPEPTAAALGMVGVILLLRHRRNG